MRKTFAVLTLGLLVATLSQCGFNRSLSSVEVTPSTAVASFAGETIQFKAVGTYVHDPHPPETRDLTNAVKWEVSDPSVATINSAGLVTAIGQGTVTVTASTNADFGLVTGTATLTSSDLPQGTDGLISITIIPGNGVEEITHIGETAQFIAIGNFNNVPATRDLTNIVHWQSSDVDVAKINQAGLATAMGCSVGECKTVITASVVAGNGSIITGISDLAVIPGNGGTDLPSLTVYKVGQGNGTVTSVPPGINCGTGADCTAFFVLGSAVQLTATSPGFGGWSANCTPSDALTCTVVMGNNETVGAIFNKP